MIIFLYGRDSYRLKQNLDKIVEEYKTKHPIGASFIFDFAEHGKIAEFDDSLKSVSFFDEKKLITIKNPFAAAKQLVGTINKFALDKDKRTIVIFIEIQDQQELFKKDHGLWNILTTKPSLARTFERLEGKNLEKWVAKEAIALGCKIEQPVVKKLIDFSAVYVDKNQKTNDTWRLHLELKKLANYKLAQRNGLEINAADVGVLITPVEDFNIFELIDAFANRAKLRAICLLHKNIESGQDPFYIFSMLVYQFRNLLRIKSLTENAVPYHDLAKKTGLNPFVVKKTYEQCKRYELSELKKYFFTLATLDTEFKLGQIDLVDGLYGQAFSL